MKKKILISGVIALMLFLTGTYYANVKAEGEA